MAKIITFRLPVPDSVKEYLNDVSLPEGCEIGAPVWRTDAWGTHRNLPEIFNFLKAGLKPKQKNDSGDYLPEPWLSTCQAMVIWLQRSQNLKAGRITGVLSGVKGFIDYIMNDLKLCFSPESLKSNHFALYEEFLKSRVRNKTLTDGGARLNALALQNLVHFLNHFEFTQEKIVYKQKFRRPTSTHEYKTVVEGVEGNPSQNEIVHKEKLLDIDILFALGNLYHDCEDRVDKFFLAATLFFAVSGLRVSEMLSLKEDCYHVYEYKGETQVEIRYNAEKGGLSYAKQIPPSAVEFVKECFDIILEFTKEGRSLAKRVAKERTIMPLSSSIWKTPEISIKEVAELLGLNKDYVKTLANRAGLIPVRSTNYYSTKKFIRAIDSYYLIPRTARTNNYEEIVRRLDDGTTIKLEEALFVTLAYETSSTKNQTFLPKNLSVETYDKWLDTICDKYDLKDSSGNRISINSHQFRHFFDTQLVKGGLTDEEIQKLFGRKDIRQNKEYVHMTQREKRELLYTNIRQGNSVGIISDTYNQIKLSSFDDAEQFLISIVEAVHLTEYGSCVLDWSRQPCPHAMACLSGRDGIACRNLVIAKGDAQSLAHTEKLYKEQKIMLEKATASGSPYSPNWISTITEHINNMKTIIEIHKEAAASKEVGEAAFPFPDGATPESITFQNERNEMRKLENR